MLRSYSHFADRAVNANIVGAYTTSCNTQSSVPEYGQNNCPKHVELTGIINKPLLLHLRSWLSILFISMMHGQANFR
jgi:hypothetical protein